MKPDDFEKQLERQSFRQIPAGWREEILSSARVPAPRHASRMTHHGSFLSTLNHQLSTLLWPHPKAWAGLAAAWILIFAVHFATRDETQFAVIKVPRPSPELIVALKNQEKLLAELLMDRSEPGEAEPPKNFLPRPRSERRYEMLTA